MPWGYRSKQIPTLCQRAIEVNKTDKNPIVQGVHIVGRQLISMAGKESVEQVRR